MRQAHRIFQEVVVDGSLQVSEEAQIFLNLSGERCKGLKKQTGGCKDEPDGYSRQHFEPKTHSYSESTSHTSPLVIRR